MFDKKSTAISCLDLVEASNGLASCEFSSDELVKACLNQIELHDTRINAFTHINVKRPAIPQNNIIRSYLSVLKVLKDLSVLLDSVVFQMPEFYFFS